MALAEDRIDPLCPTHKTLLGNHPDGFLSESEARRDAEYHRDLVAKAPIIGSVGD